VLAVTELLTIGRVARLSGLTAKALRHYDSLGVLRPAEVDEETGYRYYAREQVERARRIRILRELEVPLDEIRRILDDPGSADAIERLTAHRERLRARLAELQTAVYFLGRIIDGKEIDRAMPARPASVSLEPAQQRRLAADLFNHTWTYLEQPDRTERETELMIHAAHASRFFWDEIGDASNHATGEWQLSRAYATAGRAEPALHHARLCLEICEEHGTGDFLLGCAHEALARAHAVAGDPDASARHEAQAHEIAERVEDPEDRELLLSDLAGLPR
jgi:DNA-binding transcriptional MerR regulator